MRAASAFITRLPIIEAALLLRGAVVLDRESTMKLSQDEVIPTQSSTTRRGYWWECEQCGHACTFLEACGSKSLAAFVWNVLLPAHWDQRVLTKRCLACLADSMRITYEFPRTDREVLRVVSIVGVSPRGKYLPMMWETYPVSDPDDRWFDFKYLNGVNPWGLNKPPVLSREDLRMLFVTYEERTKRSVFE